MEAEPFSEEQLRVNTGASPCGKHLNCWHGDPQSTAGFWQPVNCLRVWEPTASPPSCLAQGKQGEWKLKCLGLFLNHWFSSLAHTLRQNWLVFLLAWQPTCTRNQNLWQVTKSVLTLQDPRKGILMGAFPVSALISTHAQGLSL